MQANEAIELLREKVDTLMMIADDRLLQACAHIGDNGDTSNEDALKGFIRIRARLHEKLANQGRITKRPSRSDRVFLYCMNNVFFNRFIFRSWSIILIAG